MRPHRCEGMLNVSNATTEPQSGDCNQHDHRDCQSFVHDVALVSEHLVIRTASIPSSPERNSLVGRSAASLVFISDEVDRSQ